jgi:hypothetical protein
MGDGKENDRGIGWGTLAGIGGLAVLAACASPPAVEGLGQTGVRVRADQPLANSATLQPEAERYCRQFGRIAEPAGVETAGKGETWYRYNCLPE